VEEKVEKEEKEEIPQAQAPSVLQEEKKEEIYEENDAATADCI
jgi:hypothetical protein